MKSASTTSLAGLGWILDEHIMTQPGVRRALVLTADGLPGAVSRDLERDLAERTAASVSGLQSLGRAVAEFAGCAGEQHELLMIQYGGGCLLMMAAGEGTYLAVATDPDADISIITGEMARAVSRLGRELGVAPRGGAA
ncbi:roadblock/LC7 domain-containing protein [Streptomyces calidiresistens]|uniref:Roadblock/LC7 domain-containing protein n=1 Tax=Streptomyces calidiresistens TaxID=1485586 RepID=A0A7W3XY03_9ACTN|nr:roadblock/LC7 domain-containing protein [Streptomyces calidiresistens]MBB0231620.1 roadblock/LC7 domain-containing protein [Streptomyces calidiresistens]